MRSNLLNVLLVEDDTVDVVTIKRAFSENNLPQIAYVASNGQEALDMLRGAGGLRPFPNVIMVDIRMPQMDGLSFLKELRQDENLRASIVYVITHSEEAQHVVEAYNLNVAGYILKTNDYREFVQTIKFLKEFWQLIELPDNLLNKSH